MSDEKDWESPNQNSEEERDIGIGSEKDENEFPIDSSRPHDTNEYGELPFVDLMPLVDQDEIDDIADALKKKNKK